jgi:hypothetical protein
LYGSKLAFPTSGITPIQPATGMTSRRCGSLLAGITMMAAMGDERGTMGTVAFAAPLLPGKTDAWRAWIAEMNGPRAAELADFNTRHGLTRHAAWLQQTPQGDLVVVIHEGPGGEGLMPSLVTSDNEFDVWFRDNAQELHGIDFSNPPPPPELGLDIRS